MSVLAEMRHTEYTERITNLSVHNLTTTPLTPQMRQLLAKGTNFVPTPRANKPQIKRDLLDYKRRLEWRNFFSEKDCVSQQTPEDALLLKKFYIPTNSELQPWQIPPEMRKKLKELMDYVFKKVDNLPSKLINNLTFQERKTLHALQTQTKHIILPADKNLGLVLLEREIYLKACENHLEKTDDFVKISYKIGEYEYKQFIKQLSNITGYNKLHTRITNYITRYTATQTANFYMLPKIHKPTLGWRPIIPSTGTWNAALASVVDFYLQPIVKGGKSYLKNTTELIHTLETTHHFEETPTSKVWLITADVEQLYPNIPLKEALMVTAKQLRTHYPDKGEVLVKMLEWILLKNTFTFDGKTYLQINGVATGSPVAPSVANIFMTHIEVSVTKAWEDELLIYKRYIDDILIIFTGTHAMVERCKHDFNNLHKNINLTWEINTQNTTFLDIIIYKGTRFPHTLDYKIHQKTLNNYLYLPWSSSHPTNTKTGIIKSEMQRYRQNNSQFKDFITVKKMFAHRLIRRGYPPVVVTKAVNAVKWGDKKITKEHTSETTRNQTSTQQNTQQNTHQNKQTSAVIVFKTRFASHLQGIRWSKALNPETKLNINIRCITAFQKTRNLFSVCKRLLKMTTPSTQA
jgi:hypothetical protein